MRNKNRKIISRKAFYFLLDAIFASMLLLGGLLVLSEVVDTSSYTTDINYVSKDVINILTVLTIGDMNSTNNNNSFIVSEIANGNITDMSYSILEQAGEYWAKNETDKASQLLSSILSETEFSSNIEILALNTYRTESDILFSNITAAKKNLVASRRMISGIEKGSPISGATSAAYLRKISGKKTNSYGYFGGFVGQGDVSVQLDLPVDFNSSRMIDTFVKIETPGIFELYINNQKCGTTYYGIPNQVSTWHISACDNFFIPENNTVELRFASSLNESYVSGGFIRLTYTTDSLLEEAAVPGYKRYHFPGIDGFTNLYDSFAVQGIIHNWTINVTFDSIYGMYLSIGNETMNIPGQNVTRNVYLTQNDLNLPFQTVPLRMGVTNLSNITILGQGQPSDSFLVTDVSGSMGDCSGQYIDTEVCRYQYKQYSWSWWWSTVTCEYNGISCNSNECGISPLYSTRNYEVFNQSICRSLLDLAKEADNLFVDTIFNESMLHRVGLVDYSTNAQYENLTNIISVLKSRIDGYVASGGTCTCCGINLARNIINSSDRNKFIIVLSDGEPNYYCSNYDDYTGNSDGSSGDVLSSGWAINASKLACQNNITVYSIGFGTAMTAAGHDIMRQIACNSSLYYNVTNVDQLADIYRNISNQILLAANFSSQTLNVVGNFSQTKLYPESYIDIYYEDISNITVQNKISLVIESEQFNNCSASVYIPSSIIVQDAYVTSYSGNHWTDNLIVNGQIVFNLTYYSSDYESLGDPFIIQIPVQSPAVVLRSGMWNNISLRVGDNPNNFSDCSDNNTLIYTALVNVSIARSPVLQQSEGCLWHIDFEDGQSSSSSIPMSYSGTDECYYTESNISYKDYDAYDVSVYNIMHSLDFDNNGLVDINLNTEDLEVIVTTVEAVPYLWGPSIIEARVWR
jgi:hypothetical protein